jgi:acetyl-CoA synthetase
MATVLREGRQLQLKLTRFLGLPWLKHVRNFRTGVQSCAAVLHQQILTSPLPEFDGLKNIQSYEELYKFSLDEPDIFWGKLARNRLSWFKDFDEVKDVNMDGSKIKWFLNGKINASGNARGMT